ncbi:MAG: amidohydrolase/deacetylase family metallohydrolase [Candidatus Eremiobacteraeota bacterium]|nr:amidohydrolase/deacetylase family metallohydrolase [Candidatus Eremiobacteraeota bacterium]
MFDPAAGLNARLDVGISGGRVAAIGPSLAREVAGSVVNAEGCYVTPGLIDLHSHVYWGVSEYGVDADRVVLPGGVTTTVDAGSSGAANFAGFKRYVIEPSRTRILAFVHLGVHGIQPPPATELRDIAYADADRAAETVLANPDECVGIKIRMSDDTVGEHGARAFSEALRAAELCRKPLMVHIGRTALPLEAIFDALRRGDIVTHCYTPQAPCIIDEFGDVRGCVRRARARGVLLDVGHGRGSCHFDLVRSAFAQDLKPDTISTDLHAFSRSTPVVDLLTTLTKFIALGLSLAEVITMATSAPAAALGRSSTLGRIEVGREADLAVLEFVDEPATLVDARGTELPVRHQLRARHTIRAGALVA